MPTFPSSYFRTPSPKEPAQDFEQILPQKRMKFMSDIDKKEEARLAKSHREKAKRWVMGSVRGW
jgi:hypothetical protein